MWSSTLAVVVVALFVFAWQFAAIVREQRLTQHMLALMTSAARMIDPRGVGLARAENLEELRSGVEALLPDLEYSPDNQVRLLTLRAQVFSSLRDSRGLADFDRAIAILPAAEKLSVYERVNVLYLGGMERLHAYHMEAAGAALAEALDLARTSWNSRDEAEHWNDPRTLDVAAQYVLALLRGRPMKKELDAIRNEFGNPEIWMASRWAALKKDRGDDDPAAIEMGLALARWYYDQQMIQGGNKRAMEIYAELEPAAKSRFGPSSARALEIRLRYLASRLRAAGAVGLTYAEKMEVILPGLLKLQAEIDSRFGREDELSVLAAWRVAVCYLEVQDHARAAQLYPDVVERMTRFFGSRHLDSYKARTGMGIALAYVDPARSADVLHRLTIDMEEDPEIGRGHEATCIALRASQLPLRMLDRDEDALYASLAAFQARGGWESLPNPETISEAFDCLRSAYRSGRKDVVRMFLPRLPVDIAATMIAQHIDPRTSAGYFFAIFGCMDLAWQARDEPMARWLLAIMDGCSPLQDGAPFKRSLGMQALEAAVRGETSKSEALFNRGLADGDAGAAEYFGLALARQGCIEEATAVLQRVHDNTKDRVQQHDLRRVIAELLLPQPTARKR